MSHKVKIINIAKYLFLHIDNITNLKLQKIMFFTYVDYYRKYNEELLFEDQFEAWVYGPVIPEL